MDNLCHTLTGAALAGAGLRRATPLATATLMIASNLPDLDVLVYATEIPGVAFRRGWTHGVLAQAVLPVMLAAVVFWCGRGRGTRFGPLAAIAYLGVVVHVLMDLLNNYGVRLLMPFSGHWFYGDAVFIVDLWLWLMLGVGVWHGFANEREWVARAALVAASLYIVVLVGSARAARAIVADDWRAQHGVPPAALMVGPVPLTPFRQMVIVDAGDAYATGTFRWFPRQVALLDRVPKNVDHPSVRRAVAVDARLRAVLTWTRFPYYTIETTPDGDAVTLRDVRFGDRVGAARVVVAASRGSSRPADRSQ